MIEIFIVGCVSLVVGLLLGCRQAQVEAAAAKTFDSGNEPIPFLDDVEYDEEEE